MAVWKMRKKIDRLKQMDEIKREEMEVTDCETALKKKNVASYPYVRCNELFLNLHEFFKYRSNSTCSQI